MRRLKLGIFEVLNTTD